MMRDSTNKGPTVVKTIFGWIGGAAAVLGVFYAGWNAERERKDEQIAKLQDRTGTLEQENAALKEKNAGLRQEISQLTTLKSPREQSKALDVTFIQPRNGDAVESPLKVQFSLVGSPPNGYLPVLVLRTLKASIGPGGQQRMGTYPRLRSAATAIKVGGLT